MELETAGIKWKCAFPTGWSYCTYSEYHLDQRFSDRLISMWDDTEWSPHLPDLSSPDFYLWSLLKDRVYQNNSKTIKLATTQTFVESKEEGARVIDNFAWRLQEYLRRNGGHLGHVFLTKPQKFS